MAQNKNMRFGPVTVPTAAANVLNCNVTSLAGPVGFALSQPYLLLKRISVVNRTAAIAKLSLFLGATGASAPGTEVIAAGTSIAANSALTVNMNKRMDAADFLVHLADTLNALTIEGEFEIGISG